MLPEFHMIFLPWSYDQELFWNITDILNRNGSHDLTHYKTWFNPSFIFKHLYKSGLYWLFRFLPDISICYTDFLFNIHFDYQFGNFIISDHFLIKTFKECLVAPFLLDFNDYLSPVTIGLHICFVKPPHCSFERPRD